MGPKTSYMSSNSDNHGLRYDFPKVQAFEKILNTPNRHRPPDFGLHEYLGDSMWEFVSYLYVGHILPDESEEKLKERVNYLVTSDCQTIIFRNVRVGGRDMTWILEEKGCFKKGTVECLSDYFECYIAMLYHQSPETCMTTVKCLVEMGLKHQSGKKAITDLNLSSSSTTPGPASASSETSLSANPTPPPSSSKSKRRIDLHHLTAKAFTKFFYSELLCEKLITTNRPDTCRNIFNAFLHFVPAQTFKTMYPTLTRVVKHIKLAKPVKGQNENLDRFLGEESPWTGFAAHIRLCPGTQKFLTLTHLVIANVIHLQQSR